MFFHSYQIANIQNTVTVQIRAVIECHGRSAGSVIVIQNIRFHQFDIAAKYGNISKRFFLLSPFWETNTANSKTGRYFINPQKAMPRSIAHKTDSKYPAITTAPVTKTALIFSSKYYHIFPKISSIYIFGLFQICSTCKTGSQN